MPCIPAIALIALLGLSDRPFGSEDARASQTENTRPSMQPNTPEDTQEGNLHKVQVEYADLLTLLQIPEGTQVRTPPALEQYEFFVRAMEKIMNKIRRQGVWKTLKWFQTAPANQQLRELIKKYYGFDNITQLLLIENAKAPEEDMIGFQQALDFLALPSKDSPLLRSIQDRIKDSDSLKMPKNAPNKTAILQMLHIQARALKKLEKGVSDEQLRRHNPDISNYNPNNFDKFRLTLPMKQSGFLLFFQTLPAKHQEGVPNDEEGYIVERDEPPIKTRLEQEGIEKTKAWLNKPEQRPLMKRIAHYAGIQEGYELHTIRPNKKRLDFIPGKHPVIPQHWLATLQVKINPLLFVENPQTLERNICILPPKVKI